MKESEATTKLCPFKMNGRFAGEVPGRNGYICEGSRCMAWDVWKRPQREGFKTTYEPLDPPQGECGMKPSELNCNYG